MLRRRRTEKEGPNHLQYCPNEKYWYILYNKFTSSSPELSIIIDNTFMLELIKASKEEVYYLKLMLGFCGFSCFKILYWADPRNSVCVQESLKITAHHNTTEKTSNLHKVYLVHFTSFHFITICTQLARSLKIPFSFCKSCAAGGSSRMGTLCLSHL